jgi:hypothetical protein
VRLSDLPAKHQANSRTTLLGREERNEEVGWAWNARTVILYPDFYAAAFPRPPNPNPAAGFQRSVDGVMQEIDQ